MYNMFFFFATFLLAFFLVGQLCQSEEEEEWVETPATKIIRGIQAGAMIRLASTAVCMSQRPNEWHD